MRLITRMLVFAALVSCQACTSGAESSLSSLEQSLLDKKYDQFQPAAKAAAAKGDAEALFLLGKAYALGLGVAQDLELGRSYYEKAEALGYARAIHNLGVMDLDEKQHESAIRRFELALQKGLQMPTLLNLGYANKPPDGGNIYAARALMAQSQKSAGYFTRAYEISGDAEAAALAGRMYVRAFDYARFAVSAGQLEDKELPVHRARAVEWLEKGMKLGSANASTNYGALLFMEKDFAGSRAALERGAKANNAVAHQYLGMLDERDGGDALQSAVAHYEQALARGHEPAREDASRVLHAILKDEEDLDVLLQGIKRLQALQGDGGHDYEFRELVKRYNWLGLKASDQQRGRTVPDLPIFLKACELAKKYDPKGHHEFHRGSHWALRSLGGSTSISFMFQGDIDRAGCATLAKPLPPAVREILNSGGMTFLTFATSSLLLDWEVHGKRVYLVPRRLEDQIEIPR